MMKNVLFLLYIYVVSTVQSQKCDQLQIQVLRPICEASGKVVDIVKCSCREPEPQTEICGGLLGLLQDTCEEVDMELCRCAQEVAEVDCDEGQELVAGVCVETCPAGQYYNDDLLSCVSEEECQDGEKYNELTGECDPFDCGAGQIYVQLSGECEDKCMKTIKKLEEASVGDFDIRSLGEECSNTRRKCHEFGKGYKCVESYICKNFAIVKDGSGLIDFRNLKESSCCTKREGVVDLTDRICEGRTEVCCQDPDFTKALFCGINSNCQDTEDPEEFKKCGRIITEESPIKVQNGLEAGNLNTAQPGEFPHVCLVTIRNQTNGGITEEYLGGASLLDNNKVLTVAHKFLLKKSSIDIDYTKDPGQITVRCGEYNVKTKDHFLEIQESTVKKIHIHPNYRDIKYNYAILETEKNFKYQNHISPVCLPEPGQSFVGESECFSTGWGTSTNDPDNKIYSDILKKVKMTIRDRDTCENTLKEVQRKKNPRKQFNLHSTWMCVGGQNERDTCEGDGGSPHICNVDGRWVQVGTVAFGYGCNNGNPAVYSSVAAGMCWIDYIMTCIPLAQYYTNDQKAASVVTLKQADSLSPRSVNGLKASDCQAFLDQNPRLKQQCNVQYN